jgi:superfamily I DNA/RNA helicase
VSEKFRDRINIRGKFSEVFFDEGQDLTPAVFENAFLLSEKVTCGADNAQNLQGNFPPDEAVEIILTNLNKQKRTDWQQLEANFRNTKEIFEFARSFVPEDENVQNIDTTQLMNGEYPEILDNLSDDNQMIKILQIIQNNQTSNIGILVNSQKQVKKIKLFLENNNYSCKADAQDNLSFSYYYSNMDFNDEEVMFDRMKTPFIVTYDSCKGLEFDIVIMPFFNEAADAITKPHWKKIEDDWVEIKHIDGTIKMKATVNHYYVGATRARSFLYILCNTRPKILSFYKKQAAVENNSLFSLPKYQPEPQAGDDLPF